LSKCSIRVIIKQENLFSIFNNMEIKGTGLASLPKFIQSKFGAEGFARWLASLAPEAQEIYQGDILISNWYPLSALYTEPTKAFCQVFYNGDLKGAWDAGRYDADFSLKGVYSVFVKFGTPSIIIKQSSKIISAYFRPSKLEVVERTSNSATVRITEFSEINEYAEHRIGGYMERSLELNDCQDIKIKITKSASSGDQYTEYTVSWK
jgi:hypothetical protein